ncbi:hypothetical protein HMPREF0742_01271 [Rothia aeria F0184]|uniref:Uncharacterized protein n=1 Tax=Rothia aeria F0184 TaxID=888019 RepID=U7V651_9MICC|nr:hypothetical protein HMPREF0742_01271 [Rothia aeria F0184]
MLFPARGTEVRRYRTVSTIFERVNMPYTGYACNDFCSEQFLEFLGQHLEPEQVSALF